MKWVKVEAGAYDLEGTDYGVRATYDVHASDGHYERTGRMLATKTEWAATRGAGRGINDENLEWFDTMREARAYIERRVEREAAAAAREQREIEELDAATDRVRERYGEPTEPCRYGHFDCSTVVGGSCQQELVDAEVRRAREEDA